MNYNIKYLFLFLLLASTLLSNPDENKFFNDSYFTNQDGFVTMSVNILGHVNLPGVYLLYDGIDLMSALAYAGGYRSGANINKIKIIKKSGKMRIVNIHDIHLSPNTFSLEPNDTIFIEEKTLSRFFYSSNLPSVVLAFINILLTIENKD